MKSSRALQPARLFGKTPGWQALASASGWESRKTHLGGQLVENPSSQRMRMMLARCTITNAQLLFLSLSSLTFFMFNAATFGQSVGTQSYESILESGQSDLEQSNKLSALSKAKADQAAEVAKASCPARNDGFETTAKEISDEAERLKRESKLFAEAALRKFQYAETLKPGEWGAIFGEGLALLRLEQYCSAITKIKLARDKIGSTAEITFALGAAFVGSAGPGSPQFQDGIRYLGDYISQAEASGDPQKFRNLKIAHELKTNAEAKHGDLESKDKAKDREPNFAKCPLPIPEKTELPVVVSISSAIGYNDNVLTLGSGVPLPPGTSQKGSLFNESSFALGRDFSLSHPSASSSTGWLSDKLSLKYIFLADTFTEFPERDRLLQTVSGSYQRAFTTKTAALLKVSDQWLYIDERLATNLLSIQDAFVFTPSARLKSLLSYYLIRSDGFIASARSSNPDGFVHRLEFAQTWVARQDPDDFSVILTLTGQYAHEWDQPNGIAAQFQRDELQGKVEWKIFHARDDCSFVRAVTASLSDRWQDDHYDHATSTSASTGSLFSRSDDTNQVVFGVSVPMWYDEYMKNAGVPDANRFEANFEYRYTDRASNVDSKKYDQNIFLASLKLSF
jgi:hypothetical protein